jgi:hypothetical protein
MLLLAVLLRLLQELVLFAYESLDVGVHLEAVWNRGGGEVLVVLARDVLVWVEPDHGSIVRPGSAILSGDSPVSWSWFVMVELADHRLRIIGRFSSLRGVKVATG